ncbi:MAG: LytTR family transcriptional regulator DNA-binding domain-containing protein, partial [Bacteroidales bacterium]|nr:LytTR family transcriptional regulator DNA-binding domain-containing protein [Bacteroidales bacterium]
GQSYRNKTRIGQWENILGEDFVRIHRSYLVNRACISSVEADSLVAAGAAECPLPDQTDATGFPDEGLPRLREDRSRRFGPAVLPAGTRSQTPQRNGCKQSRQHPPRREGLRRRDRSDRRLPGPRPGQHQRGAHPGTGLVPERRTLYGKLNSGALFEEKSLFFATQIPFPCETLSLSSCFCCSWQHAPPPPRLSFTAAACSIWIREASKSRCWKREAKPPFPTLRLT